MRDKLLSLIDDKQVYGIDQRQERKGELLLLENKDLAEYLLLNGVFAPPLKVGDVVWFLATYEGGFIESIKVTEVCTKGFFVSSYIPPKDDMGCFIKYSEIGKTIFLTQREAEEALAKMKVVQ